MAKKIEANNKNVPSFKTPAFMRLRWSIVPVDLCVCVFVCVCASSVVIKPHITFLHPVVGSWLLQPNTSIHFIPAVTVHTYYPLHQPADSTRPHPPGHGCRATAQTVGNHKPENTFLQIFFFSLLQIWTANTLLSFPFFWSKMYWHELNQLLFLITYK